MCSAYARKAAAAISAHARPRVGVSVAVSMVAASANQVNGRSESGATTSSPTATSPLRSTHGAVSRKPAPASSSRATTAITTPTALPRKSDRLVSGCESSSSSVPAPSSRASSAPPTMIAKTVISTGDHVKNSTWKNWRGSEKSSISPNPTFSISTPSNCSAMAG